METNQAPNEPTPTPQNVSGNVGLAILSYIGILVLIPLIVNKDDQFVKFHSKQGLVLAIVWFIGTMLWRIPIFGWFAAPIINLGCFILMIIGIVNAAGGQMKELPLIGHLADNFKF